LTWRIEWDEAAINMMERIDHEARRRIYRYLASRVATDADPRRFGKALSGDKSGLWRYRVGDHRIICKIEAEQLTVLVIRVGHRRTVYQ
jgi:mRNA interferase RelE/StbE